MNDERMMYRYLRCAALTSVWVAALFFTPLAVNAQLFWIVDDAIMTAAPDGSGPHALVALDEIAYGLAVDFDAGHLYWVQDEPFDDAIYRVNLDGTDVQKVMDLETESARALVLDAVNAKLYWINHQEDLSDPDDPVIIRADLDGSGREVVVSEADATDVHDGALDLALDPAGGRLYWTTRGELFGADLDGANIEVVVDIADHKQPSGIGVSPDGTQLYWVDSSNDSIMRAAVADGTPERVVSADEPEALAVDAVENRICWTNNLLFTGGGGSIACAALDGADEQILLDDLETPRPGLVVRGGTASSIEHPEAFAGGTLSAAYPNPFAAVTRIDVTLERLQAVTVSAYDVLGRRVAVLHEGTLPPGEHTFAFEAADLAGGMYILRLQSDGHQQIARVVRTE